MPLVGLDPAFVGYRIVQVSDLHYSPVVAKTYLRQMVELINRQRPDLVLVTGDLLTGGHPFVRGITGLLTQIKATTASSRRSATTTTRCTASASSRSARCCPTSSSDISKRNGINVLRNERATIRNAATAR